MNPLQTFYNNVPERESVKAFLIEMLGQLAIEMAFEGKDTKGIKEARECIKNSFEKLDEIYIKKEPPVISNSR